METKMAVSFVGVFVLAGVMGLMFLAVLGLIALLTHPKTREAAKILFGGLAAIAMLVVLLGGFVFLARHQFVQTATTQRAFVEAEVAKTKAIEAAHRAAFEAERRTASQKVSGSSLETVPAGPLATTPTEKKAEQTKPAAAEAKSGDGKQAAQPVEKESPEEKPAAAPESARAEPSTAGALLKTRPAWVGQQPYKDNTVYCWPVVTDPRPDIEETLADALPEAVRAAVGEYVQTKLDLGSAAARQAGFDPDYAIDRLVGNDLWAETVDTSFGPWVRLHALVKFDHQANQLLQERWAAAQMMRRLWGAGAATCAALFLLAVAYCYLKIDLITGGSRRWLLRFAAILVILFSILATGGVARMILN